ncbi:sugar kinase [Paenibacillus barengoltzii]|uniref:carbohydrate kinase family protein n=1 Tax=Paenibacillus barengoltzii TaxID=343517 RepID=UPI002DBC65C3|nr:sugar kinase [Paenibacillus barengoltzii]MEC2342798.1 sugar kinase [Paenibacillus barengoltzii]
MIHFEDKFTFKVAPNDLLTIGEFLVDMISNEYGEESQGDGYTRFPGGSPSNIAINASKLGIRSQMVSAVGKDGLGTYLTKHLEAAGMNTDGIQRVDAATSLVVLTKSQATPIPIIYRDADFRLTYDAKLEQFLQQSKVVHFSCWPISREPSRRVIERVVEEAKKKGLLIGFDPNYHRMIWEPDEDGVEYVKSIIPKVDIVKPSEDDAERLFGKANPFKQIDRFLYLGARLVIMTLGEQGAIVSNGNETLSFPTMATEVVDTTGAGDAFWSGFYAALLQDYTVREALKLGFAVSAYKLKRLGAVVDLPKLESIKAQFGL